MTMSAAMLPAASVINRAVEPMRAGHARERPGRRLSMVGASVGECVYEALSTAVWNPARDPE